MVLSLMRISNNHKRVPHLWPEPHVLRVQFQQHLISTASMDSTCSKQGLDENSVLAWHSLFKIVNGVKKGGSIRCFTAVDVIDNCFKPKLDEPHNIGHRSR